MDDKVTEKWWKDKVANGYFTDFAYSFSRPDLIARFDLKDKVILEIGYGYGRELSQFCKLSDKVYGADIAEAAIPLAQEKLKERGIVNIPTFGVIQDNVEIPFDNVKFDFIYSCFVIQHMSKLNAERLIINCLNRLSENGCILFEFYGHPHFIKTGEIDAYSGDPDNGGMYNNGYTIADITSMILRINKKTSCVPQWIEQWRVFDGVEFNNYWVCLKRR